MTAFIAYSLRCELFSPVRLLVVPSTYGIATWCRSLSERSLFEKDYECEKLLLKEPPDIDGRFLRLI